MEAVLFRRDVAELPLHLFYFLSFLFLISNAPLVASPSDSIRTKYGVNDSRNPDCLCYKYQRRAEKEYARELSRQKKQLKKENAPGKFRYVKERRKPVYKGSGRRQQKSHSLKSLFKRDITACPGF